ncbi:hypothetical protein ACIP5T_12450 [Microbacterium sp. NPDC088619]|uniref:hypothetical protein n=1 Tax=Microbacterium sp. NPDC088619 TaxID=3364196 RepID=UPI003812E0D4
MSASTDAATGTRRARSGFDRDRFENGLFGILRPIVIVLLVLAAVVPFYYMCS